MPEPGGGRARLRCALVGLGRIGSLLEDDALREKPATHAGAIAANPACRLVGGCDADPGRRARFAERWTCPAVFDDIRELLAETRPHILHVATHPDSHFDMVRAAAGHGVRVAVCEKPLADTPASARRILALHKSGRIKVLVNHERRYSLDYQRANEIVAAGRLGELRSITARLYFGNLRRLDQVFLHDGTHLVDAIQFLTGARLRPREVQGRLNARRGTVFIHAETVRPRSGSSGATGVCLDGVPVCIEIGAERDHLVFELDLSFSAGRLCIGNGVYEEWESAASPYYEGFNSLRLRPAPEGGKTGYFANMLADAVACARSSGRRPVSSAEDAWSVFRFIAAVTS